ncbi:MAG TPA: cadherin-like domain-containing protein, partial [Spirillospora sp.]|nr:cadherin-like domain-containing protein [Spirillospora sp.]
MENVLSAFILIFILIFGSLTLSEAVITSLDTIQGSYREMETRLSNQARAHLMPINDPVFLSEAAVAVSYRNTGSTRLTDFDQWDVIVTYFDQSDPADFHISWLKYASDAPSDNQWAVEGIYLDAGKGTAEQFEPGILNPGEEMTLLLYITPEVGHGKSIHTLVAAPNGISTARQFIRNIPPELVNNLGLTITHGETGLIDAALLAAFDADDTAEAIVYTVLDGPGGGTLSLADTFTQADIDNGLLTYTHTLSGDYGFEFTLSDGKDTVGPYTFEITVINNEPTLAANTGLAAGGGTSTITSAMLKVTDAD